MKKQFPILIQAGKPILKGTNPFPDSFTVIASRLSCVSTIGAAVAHRPGVDKVTWKT